MRIRSGTIFVVVIALAVGAAAGWFAEGAWGNCGNVELCNCGNVETANDGRARSPVSPERSEPRKRWLQGCAPEKPKVTDAGLEALRDKAASLEKELEDLLDTRERKAKADAQGNGGENPQKGSPLVSIDAVEEALGKCRTYGEMKQRYPEAWREWHEKSVEHATRVLKKYDCWREYVSGIDVSYMTDEELENHERLMEIYGKKHALLRETELSEDDEMTFAKHKENNIEMQRLGQEGAKFMAAERNTLLRIAAENLGRRLGWPEADTAEFAETLRAVGDATSGDLTN